MSERFAINIRVTKEEHDKITKAAAKSSRSVSDYIRLKIGLKAAFTATRKGK